MRENISKSSAMETLSFNGFQTPYRDITNKDNPVMFGISSNVYYGYQPLTTIQADQNNVEPMHTEDLNKPCVEMDITQSENPFTKRKRTRNYSEMTWESCKKRRQNEPSKRNVSIQQRCSSTKMVSDEDLLRETHGCSYYHWVASNI